MIKEILQIGNPILTTKTTRVVDIQSVETKSLIQDLLDTCEKNADISAGLASPQIGVSKSICVCRRVDLEEKDPDKEIDKEELWEVLINPHLLNSSSDNSTEWEACLSIGVGKDNLWGPVERPKKITVEYTSPDGSIKQLKAKGYFSHVVQHEIDHLNGILFVSYINNPANIWRLEDLNAYIESNESYPEIQ
jgi:peptide deformylase